MIDGVIFDKDGTLFDFRKSWAGWAEKLIERLATDPDHASALSRALGYDRATRDFHPSSPVIAATAPEIADALLPMLPNETRQSVAAHMDALAEITAMQEAVPLRATLSRLRDNGLKLGLATNDSEVPAKAHLAAHDLTDLFDYVAGCDSGHGAKPAPGMLLAFAHQMGLAPGRVAMVGDSRHDLIAGRAAGMHTVAVLTGIAGTEELAPYADVVLPDIGTLGAWIAALTAPSVTA